MAIRRLFWQIVAVSAIIVGSPIRGPIKVYKSEKPIGKFIVYDEGQRGTERTFEANFKDAADV
jgi:hypothetical protein